MIEGLKVTVKGAEVRQIADERVKHHDERANAYLAQVKSMEAARVEGMEYSGGDPIKALRDKAMGHLAEAGELKFIANHIDPNETFLLDRDALHRLGIVGSRY